MNPARTRRSPGGWSRDRGLSVVGLFAAVVATICLNVLAVRFDQRFDLTSDRRYTLSPVTLETVRALDEAVTVHVLLGRGDPVAPTVRELLAEYAAASRRLHVEWCDPDRDPAAFLARRTKLGIQSGQTRDGQVLEDSVLVVESGTRRYYVTTEDLASVDPDTGTTESHLEQALTRGLRSVRETSRPIVCFGTGHRELSIEDRAPLGLSELKDRLHRDDIEVRSIDAADPAGPRFEPCQAVVVAAPELAWTEASLQALQKAAERGTNLWLMGGTVPDQTGRVRSTGLDRLARVAGIEMGIDLILETDPQRRLADGLGEIFFADAQEHEILRGLRRPSISSRMRILVSMAQSLRATPDRQSVSLLDTGPTARSVRDVSSPALDEDPNPPGPKASLSVARASELQRRGGLAPLRVVVSPAGAVENRALQADTLIANRVFADNVIAWLVRRPSGNIEIRRPARQSLALALSEAELTSLSRFTSWIMPLAAAILGLVSTWMRRRNVRNQQSPSDGDGP